MLALLILGYAAGQNISWLIGIPMLCLGLYMFVAGDAEWRGRQEGLLTLLVLWDGVVNFWFYGLVGLYFT